MKDYDGLVRNIQGRINPEGIDYDSSFLQELSSISYSDVLKYIRYSMKGVPPAYTQRSIKAGNNVKDHLKASLTEVSYKFQGSVMTNTHIVGKSDIDLLVLSEKFYTYDRAGINQVLNSNYLRSQYNYHQIEILNSELNGNGYNYGLDDLKFNRLRSESKLTGVYEKCEIDHPIAIKLTNKSLNRDVDVVIASWYDNVTAIMKNRDSDYRGVQVYDKKTHSKKPADFPFLSIKRINEKSSYTNGRLKKMIRFLKNVNADLGYEQEVDLNSFDFNAICYDIDSAQYIDKSFYELVPILYLQLKSLSEDSEHSDNLLSVDGNEPIFKGNQEKLDGLKKLMLEINLIALDLKNTFVL